MPEIMDDPGLDPGAHHHALRGLARLNALSLADRTLAHAIASHRCPDGTPLPNILSVLDVAVGSGDVPLRMCTRLVSKGWDVSLTGVDISERAVDACRQRAARETPALPTEFLALDVLDDPLPTSDVVTCSLFAHHLEDADVPRLLASMARSARRLVILSDLERSRTGLFAAWAASRAMTRSPVVHTDAVLSVRGALSIAELRKHAVRAGMYGASIRRVFPCRMLLTYPIRSRHL